MKTYAELKNDIIAYSHRDDFVDTQIERFIELAEYAMYDNDVEPLLVRELEFTSTAELRSQTLSLPEYFERIRSVSVTAPLGVRDLKFQSPEQLKKRTGSGLPSFFTIIGDEIELDISPEGGTLIKLQYFRRTSPLSDSQPTNSILEKHYNIYLYGALSELFSFVLDGEQEQRYTVKFYKAIKGANKADKKGRYGSAPAMSVEGMVL